MSDKPCLHCVISKLVIAQGYHDNYSREELAHALAQFLGDVLAKGFSDDEIAAELTAVRVRVVVTQGVTLPHTGVVH